MTDRSKEELEQLLTTVYSGFDENEYNKCADICLNRRVSEEICYEAHDLAVAALPEAVGSVLEINSSYGNFTCWFSGRCRELSCVEKDAGRSALNALRNRSETITFSTELPENKRFDFIWADFTETGAGAYGFRSPEELYAGLKKLLLPEGRMFLLLPNAYGECAAAEKYSLEDVKSGLAAAGAENFRVFMTYPWIRSSMMFLFTEERLPSVSECYFHRDTCKSGTYDELLENYSFTDVFAVEINGSPSADRVDYSKLSVIRSEKFRIRTDIVTENGKRLIRKSSLSDSSVGHVMLMKRSEKEIQELFGGSIVRVNRMTASTPRSVDFEFVEGTTLFDIIVGKIKDNYQSALEDVCRYAQILRSKAFDKFEFTERFESVFGGALRQKLESLPEEKQTVFYSLPYTDIDICFDNIIVNDEGWTLIDYEFCYDFPIPVDMVIYRALMQMQKKLPSGIRARFIDAAYRKVGIKGFVSTFRKMEVCFQQSVLGDECYQRKTITKSVEFGKKLKAAGRAVSKYRKKKEKAARKEQLS